MTSLAPLGLLLAACQGPPALSFVVVSLDTTRADRLGAYGGPAGLTPNLDRFAAESVVFTRAYAQATITGPSHASLFTSRYPTEVFGVGFEALLGPETPTLAEVLGLYGYGSAAFVAGGAMAPRAGLGPGFGRYESAKGFASLSQSVGPALAWWNDQAGPSFLFVHGYDAHSPTAKPPPYAGAPATGPLDDVLRSRHERVILGRAHATDADLAYVDGHSLGFDTPEAHAMLDALDPTAPALSDADLARLRVAYDDAVAWSDVWFGRLMAGLDASGKLDHTVVVVLSDHGEQLGEHGYFGHGTGAWEEESHVPLLVRVPGATPRRVDDLVQLLDVAPTLWDLAGAKAPAGARGRSLRAVLEGGDAPAQPVAWTFGGNRANMLTGHALGGSLAYAGLPARSALLGEHLREARLEGPRFHREGEVDAAALRDGMVTLLASLSAPRPGGPAGGLDEAHRREMRDHGYFGAEPGPPGGRGPGQGGRPPRGPGAPP